MCGAAARRDVLLAAGRLGYRPNNAARTLASGSSSIIGLIVGDIENVFLRHFAPGLADVVEDFGYTLLVANSDEDVGRERRAALDSLRAHRVDGLVRGSRQQRRGSPPCQCSHRRYSRPPGRPGRHRLEDRLRGDRCALCVRRPALSS